MTATSRRFPLGLTAAAAVAFAILCGLGTWQLQRLTWKRGEIARVEAARTAAPRPLAEALAAGARGEDVDYTRVEAQCPGLPRATYVELYSLHQGQAGSRLISACAIADGPYDSILVDRGFVSETMSARPFADPLSAQPFTVRGVLRRPTRPSSFAAGRDPGGRFHARAVGPLAQALGAPRPAPWFLMAETPTNPEWRALRPLPLPTTLSNRHLEYAVTWFGLAAALAGVYGAFLWRRLRP